MRKLYFLFCFLLVGHTAVAQELHVNWNSFIGGDPTCGAGIRYSIATADGGILFTGGTNCSNAGDMPPCTTGGGSAYIGKLDANQQLSWIKSFGGSNNDFGEKLCVLSDGYVLVAHTESNNGDVIGFHGGSDIWILRFDLQGNLLWKKCYGGPWADDPMSVAVTPENGLLVLGYSTGPGGDVPGHYGNTEFWGDWWLFKTNDTGAVIWSKIYGGTDDDGYWGSILIVDTAYYLVSGSLSKDIDCVDTSWHSPQLNTDRDYYVLKLDTSGAKIWSKSYGGTGYDGPRNAMYDNRDSSIVIIGESESNDYLATGYHGNMDLLFMKIDLQGNYRWHKQLGSAAYDRFGGVTKSNDDSYLVLGAKQPGGVGLTDIWVTCLDTGGNVIVQKTIGNSGHDVPASIHPYLSGYVATGQTQLPNFIEGINIGHQGEPTGAFACLSYFEYWPLKISNIEAKRNKITIHPNPSNGYIRVSAPKGNGDIIVTDMAGKKVFEKRSTNKELLIDTKDWNKGIFLLRWESENGEVLTEKMVNN